MNLKEQMEKVGFDTDKILILVDGERSKALGITRLTNILRENQLNTYDVIEIEDEKWLKRFERDVFNRVQDLKNNSDIIINITITKNKLTSDLKRGV